MKSHLPLIVERRDGVLIMTLNRPEVRNAINGEVARALSAAMDELDADSTLRVGVLTGAGAGFCAGNDLRNIGQGDVPMTARGFAGIVERPSHKPLIAALEGFAAGGGLEVALACDMIVAGSSTKCMLPEVRRGLVAGGGGILRMLERAPRPLALEFLLTGAIRTAAELASWGVINRVVDDGDALAGALELAAEITRNAPTAIAATMTIIDGAAAWPREQFFEKQQPLLREVVASADAREGIRAFLEKRQPEWPSTRG